MLIKIHRYLNNKITSNFYYYIRVIKDCGVLNFVNIDLKSKMSLQA